MIKKLRYRSVLLMYPPSLCDGFQAFFVHTRASCTTKAVRNAKERMRSALRKAGSSLAADDLEDDDIPVVLVLPGRQKALEYAYDV